MASQAALAQTTSGLLGRAILACQASGALGNTVLLELEQEGDRMDRLVVRGGQKVKRIRSHSKRVCVHSRLCGLPQCVMMARRCQRTSWR